jgi:hypothetical protein
LGIVADFDSDQPSLSESHHFHKSLRFLNRRGAWERGVPHPFPTGINFFVPYLIIQHQFANHMRGWILPPANVHLAAKKTMHKTAYLASMPDGGSGKVRALFLLLYDSLLAARAAIGLLQ